LIPYFVFFKVSIVDNKRAKIVIQKATDHYPNDHLLWNKRLSLFIEKSTDSKLIKKEFKLACQNSDVKVKISLKLNLVILIF
jgi:hypothetical protein